MYVLTVSLLEEPQVCSVQRPLGSWLVADTESQPHAAATVLCVPWVCSRFRSILTGLSQSGTALINGKNLQMDLSGSHAELGVCLQWDVLLDNLIVQEHLQLFGSIKAPQWTRQE